MGELLREATDEGVANVPRYYRHETVFVHREIRGGQRRATSRFRCNVHAPQILHDAPTVTLLIVGMYP